jgi:hypothetical protein
MDDFHNICLFLLSLYLTNIKVITTTILETAVLVLLMLGIYELILKMALGSMIHVPSFMQIGSGVQELFGRIYIQTHKDIST